MIEIDRINDKLFKETFQRPENVRAFLKTALPEPLKSRIDFSSIEIGPTNYVSTEYKEYFSDIIVKTKIATTKEDTLPADICFILEHKTEGKKTIFVQFLQYMAQEWRKDIINKKPLRIIVPVVFYHGKDAWKIPVHFVDLFDVDDEVKKFLMDFSYILFDTEKWDFRGETNEDLKENVFLLTAMVLMKCAFRDDHETIKYIIDFWQDKGFLDTKNLDNIVFFLMYISGTQELQPEQLKKMLEQSNIDGGEIMATLAQRWIDEGMERGMKRGLEQGKKETARELLKRGVDLNIVAAATGLSKKELEKIPR